MNHHPQPANWFPLSSAQRSRWFLYQLDPENRGRHNNAFSARLRGGLDAGVLSDALQRLAARHPMLRACFRAHNGQPEQSVAPSPRLVVAESDVSCLGAHALQAQVVADCALPFDLAHGPLIRAHLYRCGGLESVLLLVFDHIAADGWSYWQILEELGILLEPNPAPLPDCAASYADYVQWQREWLKSPAGQAQAHYWQTSLGQDLPMLQLPTDRPRPPESSLRHGVVTIRLPQGLAGQLQGLTRKHAGTMFTTLLAAYQILLHRLTGQNDIIVGSPMPTRSKAEWGGVVGDFVNPIALRTRFEDDPSVAQLLRTVRGVALRGMANQDYPFANLVEDLHPAREIGENLVFQTMFWFQKARHSLTLLGLWNGDADGKAQPVQWGGLELEAFPVHQSGDTGKFGLELETMEIDGTVRCDFKFDMDLFDRASVERMACHFQTLLTGMVEANAEGGGDGGVGAALRVSQLPLLGAAERAQLLETFNATATPYPGDGLVPHLFERQAVAQPDALAAVYEEQALSYGELNRRANRVAHRLLRLGIRPDDRVAICVGRGLEMLAGLLGILKAGGAYVPLDPNYPADRLAYMLGDSAPVALVTQTGLAQALPEPSVPLVLLDQDDDPAPPELDGGNPDPAAIGLGARHLAYVIYTSGSTGRPKGVMVEHRSFLNFLFSMRDTLGFGPSDSILAVTTLSFDIAGLELYLPLANGGKVVLVSREHAGDPHFLEQAIARHRVTMMQATPATWRLLLNGGWHGAPDLTALCGGEALTTDISARLRRCVGALWNLYGPTETTIWSTCRKVEAGLEHAHGTESIGHPIANTQIYILDRRLEPVPIGVSGEIYIGGGGLARGYLNLPEMSAERFVDDPFQPVGQGGERARMYMTGDLGRWRADGNIDYFGRNDFQVKIRGYRIALGEIETHLAECEGVAEAVVVAREDQPGDKRLVAYLIAKDGAGLSVMDLREQLAATLAEYMVPSAFVVLESFPLTPNGKLDSRALPAPDAAAVVSRVYVAPRGPAETALAEIWQDLLGLEQVGRHDDFFDLGGHSLLAVQLVARLRLVLDVEVALRDLFGHPTLEGFAKIVKNARHALLTPILPADRSQPLPLSWAQQRLWFLDQLDHAAGAAYHMPAALRLSGPLDKGALQAALDRIVARHEVLRTTFANVDGEAAQKISVEARFSLRAGPGHDLRGLPTDAQEREIRRFCAEEVREPFDLGTGPLVRGQLLTLAEEEHVLFITQHHIVSDGWSIGVLVQEINALYRAFRQGQADPLPPLPLQYADFAAWQRQWLQGDTVQEQADFWREHLVGAPALLELPTDRPRPPMQSYAGGSIGIALPPELTAALRAHAKRNGHTLFMALLAGWATLMARLSGQRDVVVGTLVANRQRPETESLIGFFANTLALRVRLGGGASVADLLAQVKATTLDAYSHQYLSFEQVLEIVQPERSLSYGPIFQTVLSMNNTPSGRKLDLPGLEVRAIDVPRETTYFDLSLSLFEEDGGVSGQIEFASDLFGRASVERMAGYFKTVLAAMEADQGQAIDRLPLLSKAEAGSILQGFNATRTAYPQGSLPHQWFEAQAAATPDAPAVAHEGRSLCFGELNRRANQVAHHLVGLGIRPDDRVALCVGRSLEMVVGLLAILKAGAAYVPLDPGYPAARLAYMLADSAPAALLVQAAAQANLPQTALPLVVLDAADAPFAGQAGGNPDPNALGLTDGNLAYVIYTSGSTGQPKGAGVTHRGMSNLLHWYVREFSFTAQDRVLVVTSFSFDLTQKNLLVCLLTGGCLHLAPQEFNPAHIVETVAREGISTLNLTPSAFYALADSAPPKAFTSLRRVFLGGEPISMGRLEPLAAQYPDLEIINSYGPTECTDVVTFHRVPREGGGFVQSAPPIGRPVANTGMYVLDHLLQPVPLGVAGEIYIGGIQVGRGYLNRPDMSAERFLPSPFDAEPGSRVYRTGDLGRWLPDGNIDYLGRNDFQVKIRGFRIELGEIEAKLSACGGVREAIVIAREDTPGDKRLVAYLTAQDGAKLSVAALRTQLSGALSEFMVPAAFVVLEAFPLTPNGKLDRRALPRPDTAAVQTRDYAAPEGNTETVLAQIWQELLGLERVGRHDHFFELGGHSLLAVQLVSRLRQQMELEIALRELFAHPTLEDFAAMLAGAQKVALGTIQPADRSQPLPLSWAQQRLWFLAQLDGAAGAAYHMPVGLRMQGRLDKAALAATLDRIVARHEALRTTFTNRGGLPAQIVGPASAGFALRHHDLRGMSGAERAEQAEQADRLMKEEFSQPFDLGSGPLIRGRLLCLAEEEHLLLVTQHHIISDGWSMGVLAREVSALYAAFSQGQPDPLPPLTLQYPDYAAWQRQWLTADALQGQTEFWKRHLDGAPALLELPTDRARPAQQSYLGGTFSFSLAAPLTAGLRALGQSQGTTLFMTLLAGWALLMSRLSGQTDVVIGTPVANRQRSEVESLIGFFVNTLALRVRLERGTSVAALLAQVKAGTLAGYGHQDLPFEQVVEALKPIRSMDHSPIFQTMLAMNNMPDGGGLALPGLTLSTLGQTHGTTHFDLTLSLVDEGDAIRCGLEYASDLFDTATVGRMAGYFQNGLAAMVADPERRAGLLPLSSPAERRRLLLEFNATETAFPDTQLVQQLFEAQAEAQPDALALVQGQERLSYAQLNRRANQLAHHLLTLGIRPDDRVALCMERSLEMVVALLAILKAGGAYLPLNPDTPPERLSHILEESAPTAWISLAAFQPKAGSGRAIASVLLDGAEHRSAIALRPETNPDLQALGLGARHLAYVMYTSGSTGMPKGVMVEHRSVLRLVINNHFAPLQTGDCVAHCANPAFDAATWEIWAPLLNGARLLVLSQETVLDPVEFNQALIAGGVTALWLTVGLFNAYLDVIHPALGGLNYLLVGGDELDPRTVARLLGNGHPPRHLVNGYGPTETTTFAITHEIRAVPEGARSIPIGRPIANTSIYILDAKGQPSPLGVVGEIHIGGPGLARGYLKRDDLTAERFVANPFVSDPAERLYRTGDLGRWLPDGNIEYAGRNDFQIKLRGFRIELGEIEAKLNACPGVAEALVLVREDIPGDKRLVAYLTAHPGATLEPAGLRGLLSGSLAEYMVPGAFVVMDAFPLTINGKIDRNALPVPDLAATAARGYAAPCGALETTLAEIWQDLLGLPQVGRHDHFFELGGHSLLAVQLVSRLRSALGVELALRELFRHPTLETLAAAASAAGRSDLKAIVPANRSQPLPLSWAQQRLWFLDQLDHAAGAAYHMPAALRLRGKLDRPALRAALDRIVARHESLRTTFANVDGEALQAIAPAELGFALAERDLGGLPAAEQAAEVERISREEAAAPFNLEAGPLVRGQLLALGQEEYILLVTQHHIISDGWSIGILVREVGTLYGAFCQGLPDPLPPLAIQYADYAAWQRQWLQGATLQGQTEFWKGYLAGAPVLLELPADRPRPAVQSYAGGSVSFTLAAPLAAALRQLARGHGNTLFMVLLAGWSVLMARMSGQSDVVVGTPVANRLRAEAEPLIGFFVNTLALRMRLADDPDVAQLLALAKASTTEAYGHQDLPFEQVVEALKPPRSASHSPIFQVMLAMDNTPGGAVVQLPGLTLDEIVRERGTSNFDIALSLTEKGDAIEGTFEFASALFDHASIGRLAVCFETLLTHMAGAVATGPQPGGTPLRASQLQLLSDAERKRLLLNFNDTATVYPHDQLAHQLFEAQARAQPAALAVEIEGETLTYGQLNARANQLAHRLVALGIRPDDRVAVCVERSLDMVSALLAVLKAGGAFVPLDPGYQSRRLEYMFTDSAPAALLTQVGVARQTNFAVGGIPVLLLDGDGAAIASQLETDPDPAALGLDGQSLAYVIYTSGSTGLPKGVMNHHRGLCNLAQLQQQLFDVGPASRVLQFASFSFDACVWECVMALCSGASLHLAPRSALMPGEPLLSMLRRQRITHATLPSSALAALPQDGQLEPMTLILAGEALPPALARHWSGRHRLFNAYGPTETTVCATVHRCGQEPGATVPIGRPIPNARIYILDGSLQPVPVGVVGEICVGGMGVARGYLNRPDLSAERFIGDPFGGGTLYKTGDMGRWLADGKVEFLGRNDFQIKIRGFRIEPGEIEAALMACEGVHEAVVVAREDQPGDQRLVAYLTMHGDASLTAAALRAQLALSLAEYMVPSAFVILAALPLTSNGKLDRQSLPAPDMSSVVAREFAAPQGATEQALAQIWQELLGLPQVGRNDRFFDLGGHSLLAVQLVSRIRQALDAETTLRELFADPTLEQLALLVAQARRASQDTILPADRTQALPLSWAQQRLWFLGRLDQAAGAAYHMPAALRLCGKLDGTALQAALDRIVARHEVLRTTFAKLEGQPVQVIGPATAGFTLSRHDLGALSGSARDAEAARAGREEADQSFDLAHGPLIRGRLLRMAADEHILLITQHHIISDGWSVGILVRELGALYAAYAQGKDDPLPPLPVQYSDYAVWQRQWLQGEVLQAQLTYWKQHLGGAPALLELPSDRPRPAVQSYAGASLGVALSAPLTAGLRALGRRHGNTLFVTLMAAWAVLMARLSGQHDVVIGTPVANRQRSEVEGLAGFFVNTLALRLRLEDDPDVAQLLAGAKACTLGGTSHQDLPFEQVVEALNPPRSLGHSPVFQVMLALNNTPGKRMLDLPGLRLEEIAQDTTTTQFDLTLSLAEEEDALTGRLDYASDLFDAATIGRLAGHFQTLLEGMADDHEAGAAIRRVGRLPLLTGAERRQLLAGFNPSPAPGSLDLFSGRLIHRQFEVQAAAQPQAIAVSFLGEALTYDVLNRRANQLAHHLIGLGIGPDDLVALCVERGFDMIVGLLGILKAGGAYVPLDPSTPAERQRYVLEDSRPAVIVLHAARRGIVPDGLAPCVVLDQDGAAIARQPETNPVQQVIGLKARHLAYVIYTSGSTGLPKGVMVEHGNVTRLFEATQAWFQFGGGDVWTMFHSFAFDFSVWEIWGALAFGGRLVVVPALCARSPGEFYRLLCDEGVTVLNQTPSAFRQLIAAQAESDRRHRLRTVVFGGEALELHALAPWFERNPGPETRLVNMYGITETTVHVTYRVISRQDVEAGLGSLIGAPIPDLRIYILDAQGQPAPIGVTGELYVGGAGVTRGYLHRPELTEDRFVPDPFEDEGANPANPAGPPRARLYKTGDLGRWRADGDIEYLGRNDFQVKIRGFRIELGEIEAKLRACVGVREAVVVAREEPTGSGGPAGKRLVAYLVADDDATLSVADLRSQLAASLAEHMVPSAFVVLEAFPLTANGKLDRKALPAPDMAAVASRGYAPPQGATETAVAQIWQDLLGLERVGRDDHFFELGGHSLMLVAMIDRLAQVGLKMEMRNVFTAPTLAALASQVTELAESAPAFVAPPNLIPSAFGQGLDNTIIEEFEL